MNTKKIEEIHASRLYGTFIEMGCGVAISNQLLSVDGASNTIEEVRVPYSKELQDELYMAYYPDDVIGKRIKSVSKEFVLSVIRKNYFDNGRGEIGKKNFLLAASFQLQAETNEKLTHGYIAVLDLLSGPEPYVRVYHVSIPKFLVRKELLELIGEIGIDIIYSHLGNELNSLYIDQVWETTNEWEPIARVGETLKILNHLEPGKNDMWHSDDSFIVVTPEKQLVRFEDLVRDKPGIILLKGSFNPIHEYHLLMMEDTKKLYPDYAAAFLCSISRYDKPNVPINELLEKIDKITSLGYYMVISKKWLYADTVKWIRQRWENHKIVFPIGMDTLNRIIDSTPKKTDRQFNNVIWWYDLHSIGFTGDTKFLVFNRKDIDPHTDVEKFSNYFEVVKPSKEDTGISSTKIRNGELISNI